MKIEGESVQLKEKTQNSRGKKPKTQGKISANSLAYTVL